MFRNSLLVAICLGTFAAPIGALDSRAETAASTIIDWAQDSAQDTPASCGAFTFKNMEDRHTYSLYLRGKIAGVCSFHADGLTFHLPENSGLTESGRTTLYHFERFGSDVLVSWIPGY